MYQLSSFRLIACELIMACLFIVSAQVMMLVYGTWTTDMPRSKKILQSDGRIIYTYELKHTSSDSCIYPANISPYHHMTIHTHNHALTYTHIYVHRHAQHEHSTYTSSQHHIPKHHLTHHNFTSHATRSVYLRLHTFTLLPPNLTSHENNITSHTPTHTYNIRMYIHILPTASYTRYTYR